MSNRRRRQPDAPPSPYRIGKALEAVRDARARLLAIEPDMSESDRQLYLDCLDGEAGDAFEILDRVVRLSIDADDYAALAGCRAKALAERKARFEKRKQAMRDVALVMLTELGVNRVERDDFTVSIADGQPHVVVPDVKELPPEYRRVTVTEEADKAAMLPLLKAGKEIKGAYLSNPAPRLTVRA